MEMGSAPSRTQTQFCDTSKNDNTLTVACHYFSMCKTYICRSCRSRHDKKFEYSVAFPGSHTTLIGSDEINDCEACEEEGRNREANYYCKSCRKYLCTACRLQQKRLNQSKGHEIQDLSGVSDSKRHKIVHLPGATGVSKETEDLLNLNVIQEITNIVNVKLPDDRHTPRITGCTFLERGELMLCDHANCKVILLNSDLKSEVDYRQFYPNRPWDVSAINKNAVVVTFPTDKSMRYIQINPQFYDIHKVSFDKKCFGVTVAVNKIYVTCHMEDDSLGDVRELDIDGNQLRRITFNGRTLFQWPYYATVNKDGSTIYVSDWKTNRITALHVTTNGCVLFQYKSNVFERLVGSARR